MAANMVRLESKGDGHFALNGVIDFNTVNDILLQSKQAFTLGGQVVVDFSGVTQANSAALALMVEWRTWIGSTVDDIQFQQVPEGLGQLAHVCEVSSVIGI